MVVVFALVLVVALALALGNYALAQQSKADERRLRILDDKARTIIVNGYSTSFKWPSILEKKLDEMYDSKRVLTVKPATKGGTPIAKRIDVRTGGPLKPWKDILRPRIQEAEDEPVIVLAQQSLQWCFGERRAGIRSAHDRERIKQGVDALEKYVRLLKEDGADLVFVAMMPPIRRNQSLSGGLCSRTRRSANAQIP